MNLIASHLLHRARLSFPGCAICICVTNHSHCSARTHQVSSRLPFNMRRQVHSLYLLSSLRGRPQIPSYEGRLLGLSLDLNPPSPRGPCRRRLASGTLLLAGGATDDMTRRKRKPNQRLSDCREKSKETGKQTRAGGRHGSCNWPCGAALWSCETCKTLCPH